MTGQVVEFVRALRDAGLRVSLAEALDACESLRHVDVEERADFRLALQASLVKDPRDVPAFETLFDRYFRAHRPRRKQREPRERRGEGEARVGVRECGGVGAREATRPSTLPYSPTPTPPNSPTPTPPHSLIPTLPDPSRPGQEEAEKPSERDAERAEREREMAALVEELQEGMAEARREAVHRVAQRRQDLRRLDLQRRLPPDEAREVAAEVEKLARKLVSRESLRRRRARRGKVDVKGTLARSVRTGGVPFHIVRRRRAIARNKLVVLCDVSGSVWNVAAFLLRLVHRMQNQFARTHSLVFVDRPVDVTALFARYPFEDALKRLRDHPDLNLHAYSDFGNALYEVRDDHLALLDRDTVVLVLGDARTNQFDPMEWALEEIRARVRRVVWLNPEPPAEWNTHDSAMARYAPFCDTVLPCANLEQLAHAAERLLRG